MNAIAGLIVAATCLAASAALAQAPRVVMEEMMVPSEPGIDIYVRNKRPADMTTFRPERTVLYVHGATYPASTAFDLKLGGLSWMDYMAARGYDVYLLDLRGYGKSTRPKEMSEDPKNNPPIVRGDTAVKDIGAVVDFILKRRNIPRVNLMGWSWGTTTMATYTTQNPGKVERLVLYAPQWIRQTASLVQAEWDRDLPPYMAQTLFPLLVNSPGKRYGQLPEGTHTIIMEKNRLMLFEAVQAFLDEAGRS